MSLVLSHQVSKCLSCNWTGDSWDRFCSADKSHTTKQMWAYIDRESMTYTYSESMM